MNRKSIFLTALSLFIGIWAYANNIGDSPLWLRHQTISPDGNTIAFMYKGDIFTVPTIGGKATQITSHPDYDANPVWSPNGKKIAFVSHRMGSNDIFIVDRQGGSAKRLTTFSGSENIICFRDNSHILFSANIMPTAESMQFPSGTFSQVYEVNTNAGRPVMFSSLPLEDINFSKDGRSFLYQDKKGYENAYRKHHTSPITRDIWLCNLTNENTDKEAESVINVNKAKFTQLTKNMAEDRNPVFSQNNNSFYFLSERNGSFNIYKMDLNDAIKGKDASNINEVIKRNTAPSPSGSAGQGPLPDTHTIGLIQLTHFQKNPIRFLSVDNNGTLCFGYDGEIYTMKEEAEPQKVKIEIVQDEITREVIKKIFSRGADDMAVSKDGEQIAFIYHGDVYVTSEKYNTTKQITNTPQQERDIDFSPDGKSVIYSSERNGLWQVYRTNIVKKDEKIFPYATTLKEECLTNTNYPCFQATYSPDGKEVAFLGNRTGIYVINLKSKNIRKIMDEKYQYSYSDGDQWFEWSPDSKWILSDCIFKGGWNNKDVALINTSGKDEPINLTKSGYNDGNAKWVLGGKAIIWTSDRAGYRSHGSWGSENDIYIMFLDLNAYEKFHMSKEELELLKQSEKDKKEAEEKAKTDKKSKKSKKKDQKDKKSKKDGEQEEVKALKFDIENAEYRIDRLTVNSSFLGDAVLSKDGQKLYYIAKFEGGGDLWMHDLQKDVTKILSKGVGFGSLTMGDKGDIYFMSRRGISKIDPKSGKAKPIKYEGVFDYKPAAEREYMFNHCWSQVKDKFYDPTIRGLDWKEYKTTYAKFLPYINNIEDFSEMLSELLGELNGSHTGSGARISSDCLATASFGVFYDDTYTGDGLKIKEILKRSTFDRIETKVKEGDIIEKIDGKEIKAGQDYFPLLEGKANKEVLISVLNPKTNKTFEEKVKPINGYVVSELLYQRWVERNRNMVEKLSKGKIGYIHIKGMDSPSFRTLYKELLGRNRDKEAIIIDTRHNGGGWLHDDVCTLLSGKIYERFMPRGQFIGKDPYNKWTQPSCMLVCEDNYSNAHGTPWVYQTLGIGKLIGAPVAGTMTAVWWETQIDSRIFFGIPQVGCMDNNNNYLENQLLIPEILIYNTPEEVLNGTDRQIKAAVKTMEEEVKNYNALPPRANTKLVN
ncbi:MAG: S41 family peptidase [Bacteroidales bacterium]